MRICFQKHYFILFPILIADFLGLTISQITTCNDGGGNYTNNSIYQSNLNTLVAGMPSQIDDYGFGNFSSGQDPDKAYGLILCRGDVEIKDCRNCVSEVMINVTRICGNHKEAVGWQENCTVRYSGEPLYDKLSYDAFWLAYLVQNATDEAHFAWDLRSLLDTLSDMAARGNRRKYSTGNVTISDLHTLRGLMQCTPDLSQDECSQCLKWAIEQLPQFAFGRLGGKVFLASCTLRYECYHFYEDTAGPKDSALVLPPTPSKGTVTNNTTEGKSKSESKSKSKNKSKKITIIVVSSTASIILLTACICLFLRKRKTGRTSVQNIDTTAQNESCTVDEIMMVESLQYDFSTIATATDNFSDGNKLGRGGFGIVYKGVLPDGIVIAVKRLSENSHQGEVEFKNEVVLVAKLQHRNLVRLLGFCCKQSERLLIYEFMTNSSLDHFLFDPVKSTTLNWDKRYKIIGGIARGLLYLHEDSRLRIIHRDLKSSNVLLDNEMNPKISDFGMARLFVMDEIQGRTNRIVGTYGYMAPEYATHGYFSVKSDVFSFGVLILEIVSGQKNSYFRKGEIGEDLLTFAWNSWRQGRALDLVDHLLMSSTNSTWEIMRCIHIGLLSVQQNPIDRPTMAQVVLMLTSMSLNLPEPSEPAIFLQSNEMMPLLREHESQFIHSSGNEASITELSPR